MYPSLPFGPLSLPTTPVLAIIAFWLGLEAAARFGKRQGLNADDVWNLGLVALLSGMIVARLWNVIQFWDVYIREPMLILSLRPSGFVWLPGAVAAVVVAYAWMLRKAMDPVRVLAALSVGAVTAATVLNLSAHLTGGIVGTPSQGPQAVWYFGQQVHPVGIYRAVGFILVVIALWLSRDAGRPLRTVWLAGFGFSLVHLVMDAFVAESTLIGPFRLSQVLGLAGTVAFSVLLGRESSEYRTESTVRAGIADASVPVTDAEKPEEPAGEAAAVPHSDGLDDEQNAMGNGDAGRL